MGPPGALSAPHSSLYMVVHAAEQPTHSTLPICPGWVQCLVDLEGRVLRRWPTSRVQDLLVAKAGRYILVGGCGVDVLWCANVGRYILVGGCTSWGLFGVWRLSLKPALCHGRTRRVGWAHPTPHPGKAWLAGSSRRPCRTELLIEDR